jgi:hypothetical protein
LSSRGFSSQKSGHNALAQSPVCKPNILASGQQSCLFNKHLKGMWAWIITFFASFGTWGRKSCLWKEL